MSETFYKTTRLDGRDIWTGQHDYAKALQTGAVLRHPTSKAIDLSRPQTYLSVSRDVGDAIGSGAVPYRLFQVEVIGPAVPRKAPETTWYAVLALKVTAELEPQLALGPQNRELTHFVARLAFLGPEEVSVLANAYRSQGCPEAPDTSPEVRVGARRNAHFLLHRQVVQAVARACGRDDLAEYEPLVVPLLPFIERLERGEVSLEELSRVAAEPKLPPGEDPLDAATAAQRVVTALLFRDLLPKEKISMLVAPWRLAHLYSPHSVVFDEAVLERLLACEGEGFM